ncbi:MAG: LysM peptidoglycan-binding domain-containing protein [Alicyclobacillaceae bacterium]|nr:LysM peptidoglycan-binding domain-containing protein [Alicyclobacillaceae bacterium]
MPNAEHSPMIRVSIEQEIFMDSVREHDQVADATVATEVISFDRAGDAYVLEGAIVFSGFLTRPDEEKGQTEEKAVAILLDEDPVVHVHHRLPFVMRVPVEAQPRGVINVKSRLSGWRLTVSGASWLKVSGELEIAGLSGSKGYHFQCGSQEMGDIFFMLPPDDFSSQPSARQEPTVEHVESPVQADAASDATVDQTDILSAPANSAHETQSTLDSQQDQATEADESMFAMEFRGELTDEGDEGDEETRGLKEVPDHDSSERANVTAYQTELLSEARSGHGQGQDSGGVEIARELSELDRFVPDVSHDVTHDFRQQETIEISSDVKPAKEMADAMKTEEVAQYSFENQVSDPFDPPHLAPRRARDESDFSIARAFSHASPTSIEGSTAPSASIEQDGVRGMTTDSPSVVDEDQEVQSMKTNASLWSFVDFNVPDTRYTLRFVVVMEEDTLESIADRVGVSKRELMTYNHLHEEVVLPGQTLQVPSSTVAQLATR